MIKRPRAGNSNREALLVAALMIVSFPATLMAATVDVLVLSVPPKNPVYFGWDDFEQATSDMALFLEAAENSGAKGHVIRLHGPVVLDWVDESQATSLSDIMAMAGFDVQDILDALGWDLGFVYTSVKDSASRSGISGYDVAIVGRGYQTAGAHEMCHLGTRYPNSPLHEQGYCQDGMRGLDTIYAICPVNNFTPMLGPLNAAALEEGMNLVAGFRNGPSPPGVWHTSVQAPGFEFQARITGGSQSLGVMEADCIPETACFSGALPGRTEVQVKVIGPRPNGYLWTQITRSTPSKVEVWIRQISSGEVQYYLLPAVGADSDDVSGLQDRDAFLPTP